MKSASPLFEDEDVNEIITEIKTTLKSGMLAQGPHVKEFEERFAKYIQVDHAIAVNSGTSALEIPLRYYELKGKEVIVTTNTLIPIRDPMLMQL